MMLLEGQQYSHYRLVRLLKHGGMGEVYLAEDTSLQRHVAIKVIRTDLVHTVDEAAAREAAHLFSREARAIAQLDHPHILPLYDSGEVEINNTKVMYMVMPLRHEGSFADWLHAHTGGGALPLAGAERVVRQAAEALQHAHDRQIIHKDVKPSNFLVREHAEHLSQLNLQLADFGVAKLMRLTSESQVIRGTPGYMAPEQWEGRPEPATDQYALAVMAYELLTGRHPFEGQGYQQLWYQHAHTLPASPSIINPSIPGEIDTVLLRALEKDPQKRFSSISTFAHAFHRAVLNSGNIHQTITVSVLEAQRGANRLVTLPNGRQVTILIPAGTYQGQIIRMENYGYPTTYDGPKGALLLTITILSALEETILPFVVSHAAPTVPIFSPTEREIPSLPPVPPARLRTRRNRGPVTFIGILCVLILAAIPCYATLSYMQARAISTTHETATLTATGATATKATAKANAAATKSVIIASTATAQAQATATIVQENPYPSYFPGGGQLALYDPLKDDSEGDQWLPTTSPSLPTSNGNCTFQKGGLDARVDGDEDYIVLFHPCIANNTGFSDFAYEVHMTLLAGDCGGVTFRGHGDEFYYFIICQDGRYRVIKYTKDPGVGVTPTPGLNPILTHPSSRYTPMNLNQDNLIAVWAEGGEMKLYVNGQLIDTIQDASYSSGQIGVLAKSWNLNTLTEAIFSDARVWALR